MRKFLGLMVVSLFVVFATASSVYALGVANSTHTAFVTFPASAGAFTWDIAFKKVSDNSTVANANITWNASAIALGTANNWVDSEVYAVIHSTLTRADAHIEIYQDNVNSAVYKATQTFASDGTSKAFNGLVLSTTSAGHANGSPGDLPFAWRASTTTKSAAATQTVWPPQYSGTTLVSGLATGGMYFLDKSDTGYDSAANKAYRTIADKQGLRYGGGAGDIGGSPSGTFYIYFGANFEKAMGGMTYGSDRVIFRGFYE
ncbi:MAG: hypothetical protein LBO62_04635 [Endomicrobium sp.]|jgi:hypothetical protein|nr:hypothetical protein [Endomicrobium sp.]